MLIDIVPKISNHYINNILGLFCIAYTNSVLDYHCTRKNGAAGVTVILFFFGRFLSIMYDSSPFQYNILSINYVCDQNCQ